MFGFKTFRNESDNYVTPAKFKAQAQKDIETHVENIRQNGGFDRIRRRRRPHLLRLHGRGSRTAHAPLDASSASSASSAPSAPSAVGGAFNSGGSTADMTYGSSPLRKTVSIDSSDTSSMDSGSSRGADSRAGSLYLNRQRSSSSTIGSSVFSTMPQLAHLYTTTTAPSLGADGASYTADGAYAASAAADGSRIPSSLAENGCLSLNDALPKDFTDYYAPEPGVERFSNGRPTFTKRRLKSWELNDIRSLLIYPAIKPEWHGKIPAVVSPYPNFVFRIQIIPLRCTDAQFAQSLANSDIYRESKFDAEFRINTASYIVRRARSRHRSILETNYAVPADAFAPGVDLVGDPGYDTLFLFEWRNVIENYMLNLGIENQCRHDFKDQIAKVRRINVHSESCRLTPSDSLYKKVLAHNNTLPLDEATKQKLWREIQRKVYGRLNLECEMRS